MRSVWEKKILNVNSSSKFLNINSSSSDQKITRISKNYDLNVGEGL